MERVETAYDLLMADAYLWLVKNDPDFELLGIDQRGEAAVDLVARWIADASGEFKREDI